MIDLQTIAALQNEATQAWHRPHTPEAVNADPLQQLVLSQHRANFDLWHQEDAARDPVATDAQIAAVKRRIDTLNQLRNNLAEQVDELLLQAAGEQNPAAPLHSETPGLIIDRLSILSLKVFHTAEEAERTDADTSHRQRAASRLLTLQTQQKDLARCLQELWQDVLAGHRRFKVYRQLKMYNDPTLNPVLYRARPATAASNADHGTSGD